jgi:hypothetical protein
VFLVYFYIFFCIISTFHSRRSVKSMPVLHNPINKDRKGRYGIQMHFSFSHFISLAFTLLRKLQFIPYIQKAFSFSILAIVARQRQSPPLQRKTGKGIVPNGNIFYGKGAHFATASRPLRYTPQPAVSPRLRLCLFFIGLPSALGSSPSPNPLPRSASKSGQGASQSRSTSFSRSTVCIALEA